MTPANGVVVYKMSGSGNDFVFLDSRTTPTGFVTPARIREICDRRTGVGGDGLCLLEPADRPDAVRLHYFNRDGQRAEMCGNASLCAARLVSWVEIGSPEGVVLCTDAGPVPARPLPGPGERAEISIGGVSGIIPAPVELEPGEMSAHFVRVGVPHLVLQVENLDEVDVVGRGRFLRFHPAFSDGANVSFVAPLADHWRMRTYERGVEQETLACGTGSVAVATILARICDIELPVQIQTSSGRILEVSGRPQADGSFKDVCLRGEGRLVFRAILGS